MAYKKSPLSTTGKIAGNHFFNRVAQQVYGRTKLNLPKPVRIYATINSRCNAKCLSCDYWQNEDNTQIPTDVFIDTLMALKKMTGSFFVNISGGEPFLYKGIYDVLEICRDNEILVGITTNGSTITKENAEKMVKAGLFNCNISVDGSNAQTHDYLRGTEGLFDTIMESVETLEEAKLKNKSDMRIIWKATVNGRNIEELPDLVRLAREKNVTGVQFQPINEWTDFVAKELWVNDFNLLGKVIEELVFMKANGYPILSTEWSIRMWEYHFKKEMPENMKRAKCSVCYTNFMITQNGDVKMCWQDKPIGNILNQSVEEIWKSDEANNQRLTIPDCQKLCLNACVVPRNLKDSFNLMTRLLGKK